MGHARVDGIEFPRTDVLTVVITPAARLGGVAKDATGKPLAGARLLLLRKEPEATALVAESLSDLQGRFRFPGLRAGTHAVQVFAHGGPTPKLEQEVALAEGQALDAIELRLR
jgi:class 3 adenylate cyclase